MDRFPAEFADMLGPHGKALMKAGGTDSARFAQTYSANSSGTTPLAFLPRMLSQSWAKRARQLLDTTMLEHVQRIESRIPQQAITGMRRNYSEKLPKSLRIQTVYFNSPRSTAYRAATEIGLLQMLRSESLAQFAERITGLRLDRRRGVQLILYVAPEFYFHGTQGPYLYGHDDPDPADFILDELRQAFPASDFPDWTLVCGSAITSRVQDIGAILASNSTQVRNAVVQSLSEQWLAAFGPLNGVVFDMLVNFIKNCHGYPCMEVRNRAMIVSNVALDTPTHSLGADRMTCEKYFVSNEDFILYDTTGRKDVVTEQMTAYPFIDLSHGDLKATAKDKYAIFRQNYGPENFPQYVDFGVEICLDHSDVRLRRNIDHEPWPQPVDALHVQIIPSCGMQIAAPSVAADAMGFVFNCDGQYALDATNGTASAGLQSGVQCVYANYIDSTNPAYAGAHPVGSSAASRSGW